MEESYRIAVVDDVASMRKLFEALLKDRYRILPFANGREFLESGETVDMVLLDIEMPDMDGYSTCRVLREGSMANIPVLFVSGHDSAQDRLAAYQAGGDDFITKPIVADELRIKVDGLVGRQVRLRELESQSSMAQQIAFSAMSSMGALGVILEFMRGSAEICDPAQLSPRLRDALHAWGLRGAVRLRTVDGMKEAYSDAEQSPLQASVMAALSDMGRIFQMRSRAIVNYPHVTLLVENLPTDDEEALGRIRDNLAMLGETAETTLRGLDAMALQDRQRTAAREALNELQSLLRSTGMLSAQNRSRTEQQLLQLKEDIQTLLRGFGLTQVQESMVADELERCTGAMLQLFDEATHIDIHFAHVVDRLRMMGLGDSE